MSLFAAIALFATAEAAPTAAVVDLDVRGASAPDRSEVVEALGVRGVEVHDSARVRAMVDCEEVCRVRISGSGGSARAEVSLVRAGDEPLARAVALAVATALEDVEESDAGTPTVALGVETSSIPRVSLGAAFHVPFWRFDWHVGPLLAVSLAHYRGGPSPRCCGAAWPGSLVAVNTGFAAHIGGRWQVEPGASMRVGYATPLFTSASGIVAASSRFGVEVTPSVALRSPNGLALRASVVVPTYAASRPDASYHVTPTAELALVAALR